MPNKLYQADETAIRFINSGGDVTFSPASVADGAGRISAQHDFGASSHANFFNWRAETQAQATPTLGAVVRMFLVLSDETTDLPGRFGTSDAAVSTEDLLRNLTPLGHIVCDNAGANTKFIRHGTVFIPTRYVSLLWWNDLGATLTSDNTEHFFDLTPIPPELQ